MSTKVNYDSDVRAPFEFTKPSTRQQLVGCPKCKIARSFSISTIGFICNKCNIYVPKKDFLPSDKCIDKLNQNVPINEEFTKRKAEMERKAYEWRDEQEKKGNLGTRSHEPELKKRKW